MRSMPRRLQLLALLPLCLMLEACPHPLTASSIARTERPRLPSRDPELTRTEKLTPLSDQMSGEMVQVDKGWLRELLDVAAAAIAAVERGNIRAAGNKQFDRCVAGIFETGVAPAGCPKPQ